MANLCREAVADAYNINETPRPINLSLSQFLKDGCIGERQMALVCKKHKRPEGQQVAHILTLNLY